MTYSPDCRNIENLVNSLKILIVESGAKALLRRQEGLRVYYKEDRSPVTNADLEISTLIYNHLKSLTPNLSVICEERELICPLVDDVFWLVDPIDGTRSYIQNGDTFTVNIALIKNNIAVLGFIYQPSVQKLYYTDYDNSLKIEQNGVVISVDNTSQSDRYGAVVGSRYSDSNTKDFLEKHSITKIASIPSSVKLCLIAEGKADVYPMFGTTMEWDIAAGHALIKAGGGNIVDLLGNELSYKKGGFQNPHFYAYSKYWYRKTDVKDNS